MNKISVVLPTYNEKGNIVPLIEELDDRLRQLDCKELEYVVVDDNSPDGTAEAVKELMKTKSSIKLIVRSSETGLASATKKGIVEAGGDVIVLMDTDFNHRPQDVPRLIQGLTSSDVVVGSRYVKGGWMESSWIRHYLSYIFNLFVRILLGVKTTDNLSGFIAMKTEVLEPLNLEKIFHGFGEYHIPLIWCISRLGRSISEVPVIYNERSYGKSKFNPIQNLINYTWISFKVRFSRLESYLKT